MEKIEIKRGDKGKQVRLVQEWLCLHGILVDIDGAFGPATEVAVKDYQCRWGSAKTMSGIVDEETMKALSKPLSNAMAPVVPSPNVGLTTVKVARQHLQEHPREVGGQNMGPWVRLFCQGRDGKAFAWCAGFVCTVLKQAFEAHRQKPPFPYTLSCDSMAKMNSSRLVRPANGDEAHRFGLRPGAVFLIRRTETDWVHTGICTAFHAEIFETIEGNTAQESGTREGIEVCARIRSYQKKDFVPL